MADENVKLGHVPVKAICLVCGKRNCFALIEGRIVDLIEKQLKNNQLPVVTLLCSEKCKNRAANAKKGTVFEGGLVIT